MPEPTLLGALFGQAHLDPSVLLAVHGDPQRLPQVLRLPLLEDVSRLADAYRGPLSFGRGLRSPRTFDAQADAAGLLALGLTVFFQDLSATLPGARPFLHGLERELGVAAGSARLSAFASPGDDGVSCHYDAEEVISVQLLGSKRFFTAPMTQVPLPHGAQFGPGMPVQEDLYPQAGDGFPDPAEAQWQVTQMQPGSVLWIPRGTWHRTEATAASLSLSIVIRPPLLLDALAGWLRPLLLGDVRWRRPLYGAVDADTLQEVFGELGTRLQGAAPEVLAWQSGEASDLQRWLAVPTSRLQVERVGARLRVQVQAMDQRWRHRQTLDSEVPGHLVAALDWLAGQHRAFALHALREQAGQVPVADLLQLLDLLGKAHYLRRLPLPNHCS